jgi:hypothetical protein
MGAAMMPEGKASEPTGERRRWRPKRALFKAALALAAGLILAEVALRSLLFSDHPTVARYGRSLRVPEKFAARSYDDSYWQLQLAFRAGRSRRSTPFDPLLGWVRFEVTPLTYEHSDAARVGERRPVLLYGDSYANCVTVKDLCWEGLMERAALGRRHAVINYGTGGYGLDQIVLLVRATLPLWIERDPIVVVSLLVNSDLERSVLRCRDLPKPHFGFDEEGRLELDGPVAATPSEFLADHPLRIRSYLWRWLLHGSGILPESWVRRLTDQAAKIAGCRELNRALLDLVVSELEASGVQYFFLLFHSRASYTPDASLDWEEPFVIEELERLGAPFLLSRVFVRAAALERGVSESSLHFEEGAGRNHLTPAGNAAVFGAFMRGIERRYHEIAALRWLGWDLLERQGEATSVRWQDDAQGAEPAALVIEFGAPGLARMHYTLAARAKRLSAHIRREGPADSRTTLSIRLDGRIAREEDLGPQGHELELDLHAAQTLEITVRAEGPLTVRFLEPRIEGRLPGSIAPLTAGATTR